ncbi:MAG TPA: hypothetical protein VFJ62_00640 [Usitatibacter sp.]|nr:hypothetical protein [Usitatibacter sp.]
MSMAVGLSVVIATFVGIMAGVLALAFRERRVAQRIDAADIEAQNASDARILTMIFGSIIGGMVLTLVTATIIFAY